MQNEHVLGFSQRLYDTLQEVGYLAVPHEAYDGIIRRDNRTVTDRTQMQFYLLDALIGVESVGDEYRDYVNMLYEAIDDDQLRELVEEGALQRLFFARPNYYVAIER